MNIRDLKYKLRDINGFFLAILMLVWFGFFAIHVLAAACGHHGCFWCWFFRYWYVFDLLRISAIAIICAAHRMANDHWLWTKKESGYR